jgi:universal stress protein A
MDQDLAMKSRNVARQPAKVPSSVAPKALGDGQRPITIRKILVPTDFSPASRKSLSYALRFAEELNSEITLLHVLEPETPLTLAGRSVAAAFSEEELADAGKGLRGLADSAKTAGVVGTQSILRIEVATHEIVEAAKELDVDLIVIATHGFTGWKLSSGSLVNRPLSFARACRQASVQAKSPNSPTKTLILLLSCLTSEDAQKMEGFWQPMPSSGGQGSSWYRHEKTEYSKYSRADRFLKDVDRRHQNR